MAQVPVVIEALTGIRLPELLKNLPSVKKALKKDDTEES